MKKINLSLVSLLSILFISPALANDVMVASAMQRCTSNEECALVTNSCADNCAFVPVNKSNLPAVEGLYQSRCGKPMGTNAQCTTNPPMAAACINSRCTIDYAYANNAGPKDYQSGAYPVPQKAEPSKVKGDYSKVNDRGGFTAYDIPDQNDVKQNTMGTLTTTIYVPPSAPVSGGNYVPVGQVPVAPAPQAPPVPSNIPPAAVPQAAPNAAPTNVVPAPAPAPVSSAPAATAPNAPYEYVPPPTQPAVSNVPPTQPGTAQVPRAPIPAVGATGRPIAPAGSVPIPPSDLKPAPTLVPPPGTAVPPNPDDPGATPPDAALIKMVPNPQDPVEAKKSFGGLPSKKSTTVTN